MSRKRFLSEADWDLLEQFSRFRGTLILKICSLAINAQVHDRLLRRQIYDAIFAQLVEPPR